MKHWLAACAVTARQKLRALPWNALGLLFSACIIAVAAVALYQLLRNIDPAGIVAALHGKSNVAIALAALFVAAAYVNFTFYDLFALRTIGVRVPYRFAALASFCGYGIANNIGLTLLVSGAVRYRIYSAVGLTLSDIAKIAFIATLTYVLGNVTVLSLGMIVSPTALAALDGLPPTAHLTLGVIGLTLVALYLGWIARRPRTVGPAEWTLELPNLRRSCLQIGIGAADLLCSASAMYLLMPREVNFITLLSVFGTSTLLGFASASPGGLGVFDAAMLFAFVDFDREQMLATLLIYRLLYYVVPFAGAVLTLGLREAWMQFGPPRRRVAEQVAAE